MTVAVKCNIAKKALEKTKLGAWGFAKHVDLELAILANYVESLGCNGLLLKLCSEDEANPCTDNVTIVNCNINLTGISFTNSTVDGTFFLAVGDIYGAKQPLTYNWVVDTNDFDIIGAITEPSIKVKPKAGKSFSTLVSPISLEVTDANGCKDTKQCYYTPNGVRCNNNYIPCFTISDLTVQAIY